MEKKSNPALSVIVLNYNTKDVTLNCLNSLIKVKDELNFEVLLVDNGSIDGSIEEVEKLIEKTVKPEIKLVKNNANLGFAKGNNAAKDFCIGRYILFLNSDTLMNPDTLKESIKYLEDHPNVGALTCKTILPDGSLDKDARRSFPTPWVALTHFSGLDRLFPKSKAFSKYWYGYLSADTTHEIDVLQGAYCMAPKKVLDEVGWFSEEYFLDGEDIDLSYKIKQAGYKIIYFPK